ncbi:MAG TPA: iron chelate uptake ABC transporter family permease subunit [Myxococcota bacterium]
MTARRWSIGIVILVVGVALALPVGPLGIGLEVFADPDLLDLRAARIALAVVVGAGLGVVGAALQALLRNPLADPFVLGVSGGAAMGAATAVGIGSVVTASVAPLALTVPGALVGAGLASTALLAFVVDGGDRRDHGDAAVLVGVVINAFSWAVVAVVRVLLPAGEAAGLSIWLIGALEHPTAPALLIATTVTVVGVVVLVTQAGALALLRGGDDDASRLGVDVARVRRVVVLAASALVGVAVATTGVIGFVGLLVPHAVRRLFSDDDRAVLPLSALVGGGLLAVLDAVARGVFAVVGSELPTGAVCALLGAPLLALLLVRERQAGAR